jgi:hypothetical protein
LRPAAWDEVELLLEYFKDKFEKQVGGFNS